MQMMALRQGEAESYRTQRGTQLEGWRPEFWSALRRGLAERPEASRFAQFSPRVRENLCVREPLTSLAGWLCWMEISRDLRVAGGEPLFC